MASWILICKAHNRWTLPWNHYLLDYWDARPRRIGFRFFSTSHSSARCFSIFHHICPPLWPWMTLTLLRQYKSSSIYQAVQAGTLSRISCFAFSAVSPASASHKEGVLPMETCSCKCWGFLGCHVCYMRYRLFEPICLFPTFAVCLRCWPKADAEVLSRSCYKWAQNMY